MFGTIRIIPRYEYDGREITENEIKCESEAAAAQSVRAGLTAFNRFKRGITTRAQSVEIYTEADGVRAFGCIYGALRYIHAKKIDYLFSANGAFDFSFFDYTILSDDNRWKRAPSIAEIKEQNGGKYKKLTGWNFDELSGAAGQRYILRLWTVYPDTRGRYVTRGADVYDFSNYFRGNLETLARDFGINAAAHPLEVLYNCAAAYSSALEKITGEKFIQEKKPAAMTAGGIAKRALLREMYGYDDNRANVRAFKRAHPMPREVDKYFSDSHLMRGGTCWINPDFLRVPIDSPIFKIDRNSSYTAEAAKMPDLCGEVHAVELSEYFNPRAGFEYICTVEGLEMKCRAGAPALFFNPYTGKNPRYISISEKISFFKAELDKIAELYEIKFINIVAAFKIAHGKNDGIKRYAEKVYNGKAESRAEGENALCTVYKLLNNGAWGKFAQRANFPEVFHRIDPKTKKIVTVQRPCKEEDEKPAMSIIIGSYITMRGRLSLWETAQKCSGGEFMKNVGYMDSDSVHTLRPVPDSVAVGSGCGEWKKETGEGGAVYSFYADRKAYFNILSAQPFEVVEHVRGIPAQSIKELREKWQTEKGYTAEKAETNIFKANAAFLVPVSCPIVGGRVTLYTPQRINRAGKIKTATDRKTICTEKGFFEI